MKYKSLPISTLLLGCAAISGQVWAAGWADRVSISGFASANYEKTDETEPFDGEENIGADEVGTVSGSRMGLIVNAQVNERLRFATQLFAIKAEDYSVHVDWAFGSLKLTDNLNLRTGKIKFPVGLVNEYVSAAYAIPWISAPAVIYSELGTPNGPQMTRESYTGASLLGEHSVGDWTLEADLFGGEVALEGSSVRELGGISLRADWDDTVQFQLSAYSGTMHDTGTVTMEGERHETVMYGVKGDWNDIVFYAERGETSMGDLTAMHATSWYTTLGYHFGDFLPHLTYQSYDQGEGEDQQTIATLGLRWDYLPGIAFKFEQSVIKTDNGVGLFPQDSSPAGTVNKTGLAMDLVF